MLQAKFTQTEDYKLKGNWLEIKHCSSIMSALFITAFHFAFFYKFIIQYQQKTVIMCSTLELFQYLFLTSSTQ